MMLLAQTTADWMGLLIQAGVAGVVLAWFMFRTEGRLKLIENAIDRMARAQLLALLSNRHASDEVRQAGTSLIKEIDDAKARESGGK